MSKWTDDFPKSEITREITDKTNDFAEKFGFFLGEDTYGKKDTRLTTNQLRKFFGEVKRQQLGGYVSSDFILLKPKLAYAVGRVKIKQNKDKAKEVLVTDYKINDFYEVMSIAINCVNGPDTFKRFVSVFEAIVAYHKAAEVGKKSENNND
jgi:CRISPR type III-A-associated protein Csm2